MISVPGQFGKSTTEPKPADGTSYEDPRFRAARLQHLVANAAREGMLEQGHSLKSFADDLKAAGSTAPPGMLYDRLVRIQRGESLMQLADLVSFAARFAQVRELLDSDLAWG